MKILLPDYIPKGDTPIKADGIKINSGTSETDNEGTDKTGDVPIIVEPIINETPNEESTEAAEIITNEQIKEKPAEVSETITDETPTETTETPQDDTFPTDT